MSSELIGALIAAAGVCLPGYLYLRSRADSRRSAALVDIDARWLPASDEVVVTLRNRAASPIWNCVVSVGTIEGECYRERWGAVMPGHREERIPATSRAPVATSAVEFTDEREHRWRREAGGVLTDLGGLGYRRHFFSCSGG